MKILCKIVTFSTCMLFVTSVQSQVTVSSNLASASAEFVGWNGSGTAKPLDIKNNSSTPNNIDFYINSTKFLQVLTGGDLNIVANNKGYKINNDYVLWNNGISSSIFVGYLAGTTGGNNTFLGSSAGHLNGGSNNTYIGYTAGFTSAGANAYQNTAVGSQALNQTQAYGGSALGFNAAFSNVYGCSLTAVGEDALHDNYSGNDNCAFGHDAMTKNISLHDNVALGAHSLSSQDYAGNVSSYNVAVGNSALLNNNPNSNSNGLKNSAIGHKAGQSNITGSNNSFLGFQADVGISNLNNATAIGANAQVVTDNTMILGDPTVQVGIGMSGISSGPLATLHVYRNPVGHTTHPTAAFIENNDLDVIPQYAIGLYATTYNRNPTNYGVWGEAINAEFNIGGLLFANQHALGNIGVKGYTDNGRDYNVAVWGDASNDRERAGFNVGVYGEAATNFIWAPPAGAGSWAGYFNGDLGFTGNFGMPSDSTLKTNISTIKNAGDLLNKLSSHTYYYDTVRFADHINFSKTLQFGLLAQDVESVVPNLVMNSTLPPKVDSLGNILVPSTPVKMINYIGFIPLLIQSHNEQSQKIDSLVTKLDSLVTLIGDLQQVVMNCCNAGGVGFRSINNTQSIELNSANSIILNQNDPNPFIEQTTITYTLPEEVQKAQLLFHDNNGKILKTVVINERGDGQLIVYASNLSNGIYSYSLIADGKLIDTKKMVCSK